VFSIYLIAYAQGAPVGGVALVEHDSGSIELKRFYLEPQWRRKGVATALVAAADNPAVARGATRLMLDVLPSRTGAITAWRHMGFVDAAPWGDLAMAYLERACQG
jgi:GNAT superfamily N-acetyltransferase